MRGRRQGGCVSINHRVYKRLGIILVIVGIALILLWGLRVISTVIDLKTNLDKARNLITVDNPLEVNPEVITDIVLSSRKDVVSLQHDTAFLMKFTPLISWLPRAGAFIQELPDILDFADAGTKTSIDCTSINGGI